MSVALAVLAVAAALAVATMGILHLWDTYRSRGRIRNPLRDRDVVVPTTAALRAARRGTTAVPQWIGVNWLAAPVGYLTPLEPGVVVELRARTGLPPGVYEGASVSVAIVHLRVVSRAHRFDHGREWIDYLGESTEEAADPFRSTFSDTHIWGVEEAP